MTLDSTTSSALLGALVGASVAFIAEVYLRWRERLRKEQDAVNSCLLILGQMWNTLVTLKRFLYDEPSQRVRDSSGREPHPMELVPLSGYPESRLCIDPGSLSFLLRTHDPDIANRVAAAAFDFECRLAGEIRRSEYHRQVRDKLQSAGLPVGTPVPIPQVTAAVGQALIQQLIDATEAQMRDFPICIDRLYNTANELSDIARLHYPTRRFVKFRSKSTTPRPVRKARLWRRCVRALTRWQHSAGGRNQPS